MFYDDHHPPHFHARYGEYKVAINIEDFSVLDGSLPPRALGLVTEWAALHKDELMQNWEAANKKESLKSIEPLK